MHAPFMLLPQLREEEREKKEENERSTSFPRYYCLDGTKECTSI